MSHIGPTGSTLLGLMYAVWTAVNTKLLIPYPESTKPAAAPFHLGAHRIAHATGPM